MPFMERNMMFEKKLRMSINRVERWIEEHDYRGWEPFDGLSSYLRPMTFRVIFLERILQQVVRQSPVNLRPILGIKPQESTKGRGYMAWGYLKMYEITRNPDYKAKAASCLDWLDVNKSKGFANHSWGNHFDFTSRGGRLPKHESIIVWTSLIGQAYLDAYELIGEERYLNIARSVCAWILNVPRERTEKGACLSYVAQGTSSIHNSNMLGAAMLSRASKYFGRSPYMDVAREAMLYSCSRQLPDGSWYYGEEANLHWIDNFHTGYNLDSLKRYIEHTGDKAFEENLKRGFDFFKKNFFEASGRPKYYHNRAYPIDSQCASQAIDTLADFSAYDNEALPLAIRVANWTIDHMQDKDGHFYYRQYPLLKAKTPMLHWAQATTYKALALLLSRITRKSDA
jgi:rhamnogalacturonyl hydrolase YesR